MEVQNTHISAIKGKVYRKEYATKNGGTFVKYNLMISSKYKDEWVNGFIEIQFMDKADINNKAKIEITGGFFTPNGYQNGTKMVVSEYKIIDQGEAPIPQDDSFMNIPDSVDDEVPFV